MGEVLHYFKDCQAQVDTVYLCTEVPVKKYVTIRKLFIMYENAFNCKNTVIINIKQLEQLTNPNFGLYNSFKLVWDQHFLFFFLLRKSC